MPLSKEQIIEWAKRHGFSIDNYGHLQKMVGNDTVRLKVSNVAVRYEKKVHHTDGHNEWIRLQSNYLKYLSITEDDKLSGLKR